MNFLLASANPASHVVPHRLHEEPLFSVNVGGGDIPALNIKDGVYSFFITNHLMMTGFVAVVLVLTFWFVARQRARQRDRP